MPHPDFLWFFISLLLGGSWHFYSIYYALINFPVTTFHSLCMLAPDASFFLILFRSLPGVTAVITGSFREQPHFLLDSFFLCQWSSHIFHAPDSDHASSDSAPFLKHSQLALISRTLTPLVLLTTFSQPRQDLQFLAPFIFIQGFLLSSLSSLSMRQHLNPFGNQIG